MVLHKIKNVDLTNSDINKIDQIKSLRLSIDSVCHDLILSLYNDKFDVDTVQDIMFESGLIDIIGKVTINQYIKSIFK
jgi:hypothetical protein